MSTASMRHNSTYCISEFCWQWFESTTWLSRHLLDVHKHNSDNSSRLLASTDTYRHRKPEGRKKRVPCPFPQCMTQITCISDQLRRVHKKTLTALREQACAASPDIVRPSPRNRFLRFLVPHLSTIHHDDDTNARALRSCTQVQHSAHSSHTQQSVVACARTAPLYWFLTGGPATAGCPGPFLFS